MFIYGLQDTAPTIASQITCVLVINLTMASNTTILRDQINLKKSSSHIYTVSYHADWVVGRVLHGGSVAAAIHLVAITHMATEPKLAVLNQPDLFTLHIEFLRFSKPRDSTITVTELKAGALTSTLQLQLSQDGQTNVLAVATFINMDNPGPTVARTWRPHPPPAPVPDFEAVDAHKPEAHWLSAHLTDEIFPILGRLLALNPREGFPFDGICDAWYSFQDNEHMDAVYLTMMTDCIPSMSDTLLRNGGLYDAHRFLHEVEARAKDRPGVPVEVTNSLEAAMKTTILNNTITLDIEFKRRLPEEGVRWIFSRAESRMLEGGRLDLDVTLCDQNMDLLCIARQSILALDARRKFKNAKAGAAL